MPARDTRNNVIAGAFVLASILLATAVIIVLADGLSFFEPKRSYVIRFPLDQGAEGIDAGSPVQVGGQRVGDVVGWAFARTSDGEPFAIDVRVSLDADLRLYENAIAQLVVPLLGSGSKINIPVLGGRDAAPGFQGASNILEEGELLPGYLAPPSFLAQAGYGPEQRRQVTELIRNASEASERINRIASKLEGRVESTTDEINAVVTDVRTVTRDVAERWPGWAGRVDDTLEQAQAFIDRFRPFAEQARDGYQSVVDRVTSLLDTNRPKIDQTLDDVRELADKANTEGWAQVERALTTGQTGLDAFRDAAERVSTLLREQSPELRTLIANARLASDQLKLTTTEVRAAPWKLLGGPTGRKELENEVLYDAARSYAIAVSDLRAAAQSLESLQASGGAAGPPGSIDRSTLQQIEQRLQEAFERYQLAEQAFFGRLTGN